MFKILFFNLFLLAIGVNSAHLPLEPRIVGGTKAQKAVAPFIVSLQHRGIHNCGGSILNRHWILTAGHCVLDTAIEEITIVAGTNNIKSTDKTVQKRKIDYYTIYPKYKGGTEPYDIALIYTAKPFIWSPTVKAVKLPKQGFEAKGFANLYGWGSVGHDIYPNELRQALKLPILSFLECRKALSSNHISPKYLDTTNLCTGPLNHGIQACSADSGGPLVQDGDYGEQIQIGVVSWGPLPCGRAPSVFVKVADFIDWIEKEQKSPKVHHKSKLL